MKCPWCECEMVSGALTSTRDKPCFVEDGRKLTFGESVSGVGQLTATICKGLSNRTPAHYCSACRKLIIDTKVIR